MINWRDVLGGIRTSAPVGELSEAEREERRLKEAHRLQYRHPKVLARRAANKRARRQRRINRRRP